MSKPGMPVSVCVGQTGSENLTQFSQGEAFQGQVRIECVDTCHVL